MLGLDLAFKLFVDPGDLVIVEGPTYTNGNATALSYGADLLDAPLDQDGLVVEALPELVAPTGRTPKAAECATPRGRFLRRRISSVGLALERGKGRSSATGAPSRVTTIRSPCSSRRSTSPPLLRGSVPTEQPWALRLGADLPSVSS